MLRQLMTGTPGRGIRIVPAALYAAGRTKHGRPMGITAKVQALPEEPLLELAAEGGSIRVTRWPRPDGAWWFRVRLHESLLTESTADPAALRD